MGSVNAEQEQRAASWDGIFATSQPRDRPAFAPFIRLELEDIDDSMRVGTEAGHALDDMLMSTLLKVGTLADQLSMRSGGGLGNPVPCVDLALEDADLVDGRQTWDVKDYMPERGLRDWMLFSNEEGKACAWLTRAEARLLCRSEPKKMREWDESLAEGIWMRHKHRCPSDLGSAQNRFCEDDEQAAATCGEVSTPVDDKRTRKKKGGAEAPSGMEVEDGISFEALEILAREHLRARDIGAAATLAGFRPEAVSACTKAAAEFKLPELHVSANQAGGASMCYSHSTDDGLPEGWKHSEGWLLSYPTVAKHLHALTRRSVIWGVSHVALTSLLQHVAHAVLEAAAEAAKAAGTAFIQPRHLASAVAGSEELSALFPGVVLGGGAAAGCAAPMLLVEFRPAALGSEAHLVSGHTAAGARIPRVADAEKNEGAPADAFDLGALAASLYEAGKRENSPARFCDRSALLCYQDKYEEPESYLSAEAAVAAATQGSDGNAIACFDEAALLRLVARGGCLALDRSAYGSLRGAVRTHLGRLVQAALICTSQRRSKALLGFDVQKALCSTPPLLPGATPVYGGGHLAEISERTLGTELTTTGVADEPAYWKMLSRAFLLSAHEQATQTDLVNDDEWLSDYYEGIVLPDPWLYLDDEGEQVEEEQQKKGAAPAPPPASGDLEAEAAHQAALSTIKLEQASSAPVVLCLPFTRLVVELATDLQAEIVEMPRDLVVEPAAVLLLYAALEAHMVRHLSAASKVALCAGRIAVTTEDLRASA